MAMGRSGMACNNSDRSVKVFFFFIILASAIIFIFFSYPNKKKRQFSEKWILFGVNNFFFHGFRKSVESKMRQNKNLCSVFGSTRKKKKYCENCDKIDTSCVECSCNFISPTVHFTYTLIEIEIQYINKDLYHFMRIHKEIQLSMSVTVFFVVVVVDRLRRTAGKMRCDEID